MSYCLTSLLTLLYLYNLYLFRLSTLSVPDRKGKTRGGGGRTRTGPRSNASAQSSDDRSRDGHLTSCDSVDNDSESASQASETKNPRYGLRKFLDKMSPTNNSSSSKSDNKH